MRIKSKESHDPSFHRQNLKTWLAKKIEHNPAAGENLNRFVGELLKLFSDNPPYSWRLRTTKYRNPVFRVHKRTTGRDNDFLIVGSKNLIILHKFFDEQFRHLFPKRNDYYGTGDGKPIDYSQFGEKDQTEYLEAIKAMATNHPEWYIRILTSKQFFQ
jgi:hypothetical protein